MKWIRKFTRSRKLKSPNRYYRTTTIINNSMVKEDYERNHCINWEQLNNENKEKFEKSNNKKRAISCFYYNYSFEKCWKYQTTMIETKMVSKLCTLSPPSVVLNGSYRETIRRVQPNVVARIYFYAYAGKIGRKIVGTGCSHVRLNVRCWVVWAGRSCARINKRYGFAHTGHVFGIMLTMYSNSNSHATQNTPMDRCVRSKIDMNLAVPLCASRFRFRLRCRHRDECPITSTSCARYVLILTPNEWASE